MCFLWKIGAIEFQNVKIFPWISELKSLICSTPTTYEVLCDALGSYKYEGYIKAQILSSQK